MWFELNKLNRGKGTRASRSLDRIVKDKLEARSLRTLAQVSLADLLGSLVVKSGGSFILHDPDCHYVGQIKDVHSFKMDEQAVGSMHNVRAC